MSFPFLDFEKASCFCYPAGKSVALCCTSFSTAQSAQQRHIKLPHTSKKKKKTLIKSENETPEKKTFSSQTSNSNETEMPSDCHLIGFCWYTIDNARLRSYFASLLQSERCL